jgi:hypothetical protein
MLAVCDGIQRTVTRLREVDPEIVCVHVDATDLFRSNSATLQDEAARRQDIVFLPLDLVTGRVREGHALHGWLLHNGADECALDQLAADAVALDVVGLNLYPMFSDKELVEARGHLRIRMRYAAGDIVDRLAALYWDRYRAPLLVSETAADGSVRRRAAWLEESIRAVARTRARGIPLVGYTWWPLFALVTWGYREGRKDPAAYLRQMGLWDLVRDESGLARVATPLVERYREIVAGGSSRVGPLARPAGAVATEVAADVP